MPRQIEAFVSPGMGAPPQLETLTLDDPLPDEVVIEVKAAGICHTDIGIAQWSDQPRVYGHEGAGVIVETGSEVTAFAVGDRVVATFGSCGQCQTCQNNRPAYCRDMAALNIEGVRTRPPLLRDDCTPVGGAFFQQSCFATHTLATNRNIVKIPDAMGFAVAAPLGCGIQTGAGAVINNFSAKAGDSLLVIGCGAVGMAAIMAGKIAGCDPIISVDLDEQRVAMATELGATHGLTKMSAEIVRQIVPDGVFHALDSAGTQVTFEAALASLHIGGQLGILTLPGGFEDPVPHPGGMPFMTTTLIGILEGDSVPDIFIPWLIEQHLHNKLPYDRLIQTFPFARLPDALDAMNNKKVIKPVVIFD